MSSPRRLGRRAFLVGAGAAALVAAGTADRWLPPPAVTGGDDPAALRDAILRGVVPHTGVATATGRLGLPDVPRLESASALLSTTTRIRVQVAAAGRWRVDGLTPVGEVDTYRDGEVEHVWDYGAQRLTTITPLAPVRLPRASDLAPPDLARRLLGITTGDPVTALPARRVAGTDAAGLRVTPTDPATTVGRIDVWALTGGGVPAGSALPVAVEVSPRASAEARSTGAPLGAEARSTGAPPGAEPVVSTAFESLSPTPPPDGALVPAVPPGAERVLARPDDLAGVLRGLDAPPPPDRLAGRDRRELPVSGGDPADLLPGVAVYGTGVGRFVLVPAGREVVEAIVAGSGAAGGVAVPGFRPGTAARVTTPLLTLVVGRRRGRAFLLAGPVVAPVLERAALDLVEGTA